MATYWITFRIENKVVNGKDYSDRYSAFVDTIRQKATKWWTEPTSFIVFASDQGIDALVSALKAPLSATHDMFMIGMPDYKSARVWGNNADGDIYSLVPFAQKA